MYTEGQLLSILKVQSNIKPADFRELFGDRGDYLFNIYARESWNLISFLFNRINGEERKKLLDFVNLRIVPQ